MSTSTTSSAAAAVSSISGSSSGSALGTRAASITASSALLPNVSTTAALFREIHKNTWLKRLTADGKKITVGPKKSERSWVVFCVHDDSQALLEGYAEPRQAGSHNPEWIVSMQETQHISHALIPNSHEFEFVVTLHNEVVRFHAMSWEVMQEWVETLRSKLREMKILSPRENLYTKLPEIRAPLLPTRDPTSPLPAPPPVPAALVPGVERVVPQSGLQSHDITTTTSIASNTNDGTSSVVATITSSTNTTNFAASAPSEFNLPPALLEFNLPPAVISQAQMPALTSMSNTLTQNLLNMLSDPITAYSEQLQEADAIHETNLSDADSVTEVGFDVFDSNTRIQCDNSNENSKTNENSVRLDIGNYERAYFEQNETLQDFIQCERIPRPQTSRSHSAGAADVVRRQLNSLATTKHNKSPRTKIASNSNNNITELEISSDLNLETVTTSVATLSTPIDSTTNITIIQVTNTNDKHVQQAKYFDNSSSSTKVTNLDTEADIFKFPESNETSCKNEDLYKSNVQIIPSSLNSSTIQVVGSLSNVTAVSNQYSTPVKNLTPSNQTVADVSSVSNATTSTCGISSPRSHLENHKITTVHVGNQGTATSNASIYGTCYNSLGVSTALASTSSPKLTKKIILSANSSGVTNIRVNNEETHASSDLISVKNDVLDSNVKHNVGSVRYEKVFLSSSIPITPGLSTSKEQKITPLIPSRLPMSPKQTASQHQAETSSIKIESLFNASSSSASVPSSPSPLSAFSALSIKKPDSSIQTSLSNNSSSTKQSQLTKMKTPAQSEESPALQRKRSALPTTSNAANQTPPVPTRTRFLTRGLTEAVITSRPSRKDFCFTKATTAAVSTKPKLESSSNNTLTSPNNNDEATTSSGGILLLQQSQENTAICPTRSESLEQRRRSSSTSEAQTHRTRATNNNEFISNRGGSNAAMRMQQPPHLVCSQPSVAAASSASSKRMTLREQQVMQLRREIMHPGGVRLQLRRKDCIGSIAWVDAFGAIWVAGWKQKEHPVLYNALHIGDQLISIAGVAITAAADANKIIRNTNTLFVEVLIRRIPLGRGYAIRREREGQCLGLIRDGNTSTIVDVVPNSLAARHGLPPKAQSCDGSTLTFWVLTEINARPLNLFFKENEIRDRLNSVGRDISILVQPSDLITKLKKQLKSLRGYKDYLVQ